MTPEEAKIEDLKLLVHKCETALYVLKSMCGRVGLKLGVEAAENILLEIKSFNIVIPEDLQLTLAQRVDILEKKVKKLESANDLNIPLI